jgi:hypothetical protein
MSRDNFVYDDWMDEDEDEDEDDEDENFDDY